MNQTAHVFDEQLDSDLLADMYGGVLDDALFGFEQFVDAFPKQMSELETGFSSGDLEHFRQKLHKMKPSFGFVGLPELSSKAERLEKKCKEVNAIQVLEAEYIEFKNRIDLLVPVVAQELQKMKQ